MIQKRYIGPFSQNSRDYFSLLPSERKVVERLKNIYRNEKGIFILCGNRGTGKSSLKNISLETKKSNIGDKKTIVINIPFFNGNKDFHREILMQIPEAIEKRIKEIKVELAKVGDRHWWATPLLIDDDIKEYDVSEMYQIDNALKNINNKVKKIQSETHKCQIKDNACNDLKNEVIDETCNAVEGISKAIEKDFKAINEQYKFQKKKVGVKELIYRVANLSNSQNDEELPYYMNKKIMNLRYYVKELELEVENFEKIASETKELCKLLSVSQEQLQYFDVEITNTKRYLDRTTSVVSVHSSVDLSVNTGMLKSGMYSKGEFYYNDGKELSQELKGTVTEEIKEYQLFKLLKNMSKYFNITISIDELDKCNLETINNMIDKNKRMFFDCDISVLLIMDVSTAISLEEKSDYISTPNIIVVPDLSILDYIHRVNSKGMELSYDFIEVLGSYFKDKMNNRELNYDRKRGYITFYDSQGFELYKFMNSNLYKQLNELYKPIVLKFYWELIDLLYFAEKLSKEDYEQFEYNFFEKNNLKSLKVKYIIQKIIKKLTTQSFIYSFYLEDDRSSFDRNKGVVEFNAKKYQLFKFLNQLALKPKILSDDVAFLKINNMDLETHEVYNFNKEFNDYLEKLELNDKTFQSILLQLSHSKKGRVSSNTPYRFADNFYDPSGGVDDARRIIERENTVGVILFYPYDKSESASATHQPLLNGIIVTVNDFDEAVLYPYTGYPGLHSHKPFYLEKLKQELENQSVPIYEVEDTGLWDKCFEKDYQNLDEKILAVCKRNIKRWLKEL